MAWKANPRNIHTPSSAPARHTSAGVAVALASLLSPPAEEKPRPGVQGLSTSAATPKRAKLRHAGDSEAPTASLITAC